MSVVGNLWRTFKSWFVKDDDGSDAMEEVDLMIKEMQAAIVSATSSISSVVRNEQQLKSELDELTIKAEQKEALARRAVQQDDEAAARNHLMEKSVLNKRRESVAKTYDEVKRTSRQLRDHVSNLNLELESWQSKKSMLEARVKNAKARSEMARKKLGLDSHAMDDLRRLEDRLHDLETEAQTMEDTANIEQEIQQDLNEDWISEEIERLRKEG